MSAIELSNKAVHLLADGNFKSAARLMGAALAALAADTSPHEAKPRPPPRVTFSWSQEIRTPDVAANEELSGIFLFRRGMIVRDRKFFSPIGGEEKVVIVYNAALATHLLARQRPESALLRKALSLYLLSFKILKALSVVSGVEPSLCRIHLLHMALLNNHGQISYQLADYRLSKFCFEQLGRRLHAVRRNPSTYAYFLNDLNGMIHNSVMNIPSVAPCA